MTADKISSQVVILGGGIVGLTTARALLTRGVSVTVIDAAARWRATAQGAGVLHSLSARRQAPWAVHLESGAVDYYEALHRVAPAGIELKTLPLHWIEPPSRHCAPRAKPFAVTTFVAGDRVCVIDPGMAAQALASIIDAHPNGQVICDARSLWFARDSRGWRVTWSGGCAAARSMVVCAGSWSGGVLRALGIDARQRPAAGHTLKWTVSNDHPLANRSALLVGNDGYGYSRGNGRVVVGASVLDQGLCGRCPSEEKDRLLSWARRYLGLSDRGCQLMEGGLRPGYERREPSVGCLDEARRLWLNTGHFRHGAQWAPQTAHMLAEQLTGRHEPHIVDLTHE